METTHVIAYGHYPSIKLDSKRENIIKMETGNHQKEKKEKKRKKRSSK